MADEGKARAEPTEAAKPPSNEPRILMLVGVAMVVMGASIGSALAFLGNGSSKAVADAEESAESEGKKPEAKAVALYHNLRPAFIVNFLAGNKPRYLQAELTVVARDQTVVDSIVTYTPVIRSEILNLFADQDYATLQTEEGKQALRGMLKDRIEEVLVREQQKPGVESVMLTSFVMQ